MSREVRRPYRVFLACSRELGEERSRFAEAIARLNDRPNVRRAYEVEAVRWDTDASGFDADGANEAIAKSTDFSHIDVVVVVVWQLVGRWTREEYERTRDLRRTQPKPQLLVFIRNPPSGQEVAPDVAAFREQVFTDGGVPVPYETADDFVELLDRQLNPVPPDPRLNETVAALNRAFQRTAVVVVALAAGVIGLSMFMSFPDWGVDVATVLAILASPVVLLAGTLRLAVVYRRILQAFRAAWRSPSYTDDRIWLEFRPSVPRWAMPRYLRSTLPGATARETWSTLFVVLAFAGGPIASYDAVFQEVALWERAVGWHVSEVPDGSVESRFVDRDRKAWPLGLQNPGVREAAAAHPDDVVYVHAQGQFCDSASVARDERFRCNLGPELKTLYVWLLFIAFLLSVALAVASLSDLLRLRRTTPH